MAIEKSSKQNDLPPDYLLIEQIQARKPGWKDCFGQLMERHQFALYARCLAYLKNPEDAADASQETLLRAYRAMNSFKGLSAFRTWLFAIADNQCHTLARKRSSYILTEQLRNMVRAYQETLDRSADIPMDSNHTVHNALEQITPGSRDILQLRYFADLSIEEIAATLGVGISAAKMRLYRAQDQIAELIENAVISHAA